MNFVVEFVLTGELAGKTVPSLNALEAETLPLALGHVQKAIDSGFADEAIVYVPARIVRAAREVKIIDAATQRVVGRDGSVLGADPVAPLVSSAAVNQSGVTGK